jgi:cation transport regulator ChaC
MEEEDVEYTIVGPSDTGVALATPPPSTDQRYAVGFQLSGTPGRGWGAAFRQAYDELEVLAKREARLSDDYITVFVTEGDDLQAVLDALKQAIQRANERYRRALADQAEHKASQDAELVHRRETLSRLRDELGDLEY